MEKPAAAARQITMLLSHPAVERDSRVLGEARALLDLGSQVTVLCWDRSGTYPAEQDLDGIRIIRIRAKSSYGRGLRQLGAYLVFAVTALHFLRRSPPAFLHCHDLDTLTLGVMLKWVGNVPLVFDAHEVYPEMYGARSRILYYFSRWLERVMSCHADFIITVGEGLKDRLEKLTRGRVPVAVIGSWKDPAEFSFDPATLEAERRRLEIPPDQLVVGYFGTLVRHKSVLPLIEAAARMGRVSVLVAGEGEEEGEIRTLSKRHPFIRYFGVLPWRQVCFYTALCDVMYYGLDPRFPTAPYVVPNNLFAAIAAGKASLTVNCGELGRIVEHTGCGYLMLEPTRDACEHGLSHFLNRQHLVVAQKNARHAAREYCYAEVARRLAEIYERLGNRC